MSMKMAKATGSLNHTRLKLVPTYEGRVHITWFEESGGGGDTPATIPRVYRHQDATNTGIISISIFSIYFCKTNCTQTLNFEKLHSN